MKVLSATLLKLILFPRLPEQRKGPEISRKTRPSNRPGLLKPTQETFSLFDLEA
jgi:hypothetical protein